MTDVSGIGGAPQANESSPDIAQKVRSGMVRVPQAAKAGQLLEDPCARATTLLGSSDKGGNGMGRVLGLNAK